MKLDIGKAVCDIITKDTALHELVKNKVYPIVVDQDTSFPFIVYRRGGLTISDNKNRYTPNKEATIEVVVVSMVYKEGLEIAESVVRCLCNSKGMYNGVDIKYVSLTDASEDYVEDAFVQTLTFKIIF